MGGFIPTFERALDQIGIHEDGYSTVDLTTSPFQTLTEKDKEIIQMSVDDIYVKFITKVAEGRSMSVEEVDGIARGKVWIGEKALEIGLIDELGDLEDAILAAAELAKLEANNYGVKVVGITVSKEQIAYAKENSDNMDVDFRLMDYRDLNETFDAIYSIGMFEAVGYKNYREFFEIVRGCLKDDGAFLLHTIGGNESTTTTDPWVEKYIFPNGMMPSAEQITKASEGIFIFDDWHNIGPHYDKTLMCWYENFVNNYEKLKTKYDNEFYRMWTFWLLSSAANFRSRTLQLWQVLFSLEGSERPIQTYR